MKEQFEGILKDDSYSARIAETRPNPHANAGTPLAQKLTKYRSCGI